GGPRSRTLTKAIPDAPVVTVSVVTGLWVESFVTSVTGPGDTGSVIEYSTGRPARPTVSEPPPLADSMVSATSTLSESETESAGSATVSTVESDVANSVSAAASTKTPPTQLPPLPLPGDRGRGGRLVRAPPPRRLEWVRRRRGRAGPVSRARSTSARRALWAGA